jgi:tetratricopeptide (TPR) repeat protein
MAHFDRALAIRPDYTQARLGQAVSLQQLGRMEEAIAVFRSILGIKPDYASAIELPEVSIAAPADNLAASVITVATSIAPRNIENQQQAVASWRRLGFNVVSVNSPDEIAVVKEHFPDVEFVVATRDARQEFGKPYVYFDDLLERLGEHGAAVCGIINSDIHLRANPSFRDFLLDQALDSFVFGCRMDVPSLESAEGKPFTYGYDFFFFDRKFTAIYPREIFCMGLPWVDYWAVLIPALRNLPVKKLMTPVGYHIMHTLNWNEDIRKSLNRAIARYLGAEQPPSERFVSVYSHYVHALIESRSKEIFLPDR